MKDQYLIPALKALIFTGPLTLIFAFATGGFSMKLTIVAIIIFAVLWVVLVGRRPKDYDVPILGTGDNFADDFGKVVAQFGIG